MALARPVAPGEIADRECEEEAGGCDRRGEPQPLLPRQRERAAGDQRSGHGQRRRGAVEPLEMNGDARPYAKAETATARAKSKVPRVSSSVPVNSRWAA